MPDAHRNKKTSIENRVTRIEMFTISVETQFTASHQLCLPAPAFPDASRGGGSDDSKEPLHQHNWLVTAQVSSDKLNPVGVVIDFHQLKAMVDKITDELDGKQLEKVDYFKQNNSSAESVAKYIYEKLESKLPKGIRLENISIVEEPGCSAKFEKP